MPYLSPDEARRRGRIGGLMRAANTPPAEIARGAREAFLAKFLVEADPEGVLPLRERVRRAELLRRAYFARLALKSVRARAAKKAARAAKEAAA